MEKRYIAACYDCGKKFKSSVSLERVNSKLDKHLEKGHNNDQEILERIYSGTILGDIRLQQLRQKP